MDNFKTVKRSALFIGLVCGLLSQGVMASSAKGWEEQAWRAGFLAGHSRFLLVADMEDESGKQVRVIAMRGFTNTHVDGVFIAPLDADGKPDNEWLRGYSQTATSNRLVIDNDVQELSADDFSSQHWWNEHTPATSFAQWWAMVLAIPQVPRSGGCKFSTQEHPSNKEKVWLPSKCTMKDPVTGRPIKLEWSGWRPASEDPANWQFWAPAQAQVEVEGERYTLHMRNLQLRPAHGKQPHWPLSLVPQAFPPAKPDTPLFEEVVAPIEDLDYHKWKAD